MLGIDKCFFVWYTLVMDYGRDALKKVGESGLDVQVFSAHRVWERGVIPDTSISVMLSGVKSRADATLLKRWLLLYYGADTEVMFYGTSAETGCGIPTGVACGIPAGATRVFLSEIDRQAGYGADVNIWIPGQPDFDKARYGFNDLVRITARLTAPDGCPWDKEQTHASIAKNAIEEAGELCEAIESGDAGHIMEEAGDVLLQGVFHGDIARRAGTFTVEDICDRICKKLISRHTHIFGSDKAMNADEALNFWKAAKAKEKEDIGGS